MVLGTAGSGKTTLAIHRAFYLANPSTEHCGRTLLVTFNRCLVAYLGHLAGPISRNVDVRNYHRFARGYLNSRGKMGYNWICDSDLRENLCERAVEEALRNGVDSAILQRPVDFLVEEFQWLAQHGITNADDYVQLQRIGRAGTRVVREDRRLVFDLYSRYRELRAKEGRVYDWDDLAHSVLEELKSDSGDRMYTHVVVDEGQDFSPMMLKSLVAAVPDGGSFTFFGDMAQQIYGNRMSWRSAGLQVRGRIWEFEDNYRNTRQIAQLALAVAKMPYFTDDVDLVAPKSPTADGPLPVLVSFTSEDDELTFIAEWVKSLGPGRSAAVLVRDGREVNKIRPVLPNTSVQLHRDLESWPLTPGVFYGTYHSAKGLEFDAVLLPRMSEAFLPHPRGVAAFGVDDASRKDQLLVYVGVTRAKETLILTHAGPLTTLLPSDDGIYRRASP